MNKTIRRSAGILLFLAAASPALADTRTDSLSMDPRLGEDLDIIWMYPNQALEYRDTADFRLNNSAAQTPGDLYGFGSEASASYAVTVDQYEWGGVLDGKQKDIGVLGVYVNRPFVPLYGTVYGEYWRPVGGTTAWASGTPPGDKVDLFWAQSYGSANLGLRLGYGSEQSGNTDYTRTAGLEVGLGFSGEGAFNEADFHAGYSLGAFQDGPIKDNGIYSADLGTLLRHDMGADDDLRLFGDLGLDQYQDTSGAGGFSQTLVTLGAGLNHEVGGGKGLLSTGLVAQSRAANTFYNAMVGWNGSAEAPLAEWMVLRAGLFKPIFDQLSSGGVTSDPTPPNTVVFSVGAGFRWENFSLDTRVLVKSLEFSLQNFEPGNGIAFSESSGAVAIVNLVQVDLRYLF